MNDTSGPLVFVGVDGGGSRCRVRVVDRGGQTTGSAEGGSANIYLDFDRAIAEIRTTVLAALRGSSGPLRLGLGLAGASALDVSARVEAALSDLGSATVVPDGVIACLGAHAGADGGLVIAGTGSAAVVRLQGVFSTIGGRGFVLGDDGSGAQIGRAIWRRALRAQDGMEAATPLLRGLMADFDGSIVAVTRWARAAPSSDFASVVPRVFDAAEQGDAAAVAVLADAAVSIGELIETVRARGAPRVCLVGGLAEPLQPYLRAEARGLLSSPLADALTGALILAGAPVVIEQQP